MRWPWLPPRRGDVMAGVLLIVLFAIFVLSIVAYPRVGWPLFWGKSNFGFGPEWDCHWVGKGEPYCIKKTNPGN
jgi:hypothetical protein